MNLSKKQCKEAWLDEIRPFGDVLEIGSGLLFPLVHPFRPKSYAKIDIEKELWQTALPLLGTFDFILYDGPVIEKGPLGTGDLLLKESKKLSKTIQEALPAVYRMRYSDRDLDAFSQRIGEEEKPYLSRFLSELLENGQITEEQHERQIEKCHLTKPTPKKAAVQEDHLFECIQECLKHMRKRSRFSCLIGVASLHEDPRFIEHIIANPSLDYREKPTAKSNYMLIEML